MIKNFNEFINESELKRINEENIEIVDFINEKLVTFGNKAYPKFGNIVILAGGAGSGKGFIKDNLLGIEGWTFDVDDLKTLALKANKFKERVQKDLGRDLNSFDLKNPEDVSDLHYIVNDFYGMDDKKIANLYKSVLLADPKRKPNIIFDVTLKDMRKLQKLTDYSKKLGYDNKNIHIVWVVNDVEVAKEQNKNRPRTVPEEILVNTHRGASATMSDIINMGKNLSKYMDGDIVFVFSKKDVDNIYKTSKQGGGYLKDAMYTYIKKSGKQVLNKNQIAKNIVDKIKEYTPNNNVW